MGTHPIFESDFDCLTERRVNVETPARSALNQDNWDAEEKPDEQGTWNRAGESTLKQRVIMRAKRRGPAGGGGESKPSAFGGLSSKLTAPPATTGAFSFSTNKKEEKVE